MFHYGVQFHRQNVFITTHLFQQNVGVLKDKEYFETATFSEIKRQSGQLKETLPGESVDENRLKPFDIACTWLESCFKVKYNNQHKVCIEIAWFSLLRRQLTRHAILWSQFLTP